MISTQPRPLQINTNKGIVSVTQVAFYWILSICAVHGCRAKLSGALEAERCRVDDRDGGLDE